MPCATGTSLVREFICCGGGRGIETFSSTISVEVSGGGGLFNGAGVRD